MLDSRSDPQRFGELIKDRVRCGCEKAGVPADLTSRLGSAAYEWVELRNQLDAAEPISLLTPNVRNNVLGSLKALDEALRHITEAGWLQERSRSLSSTSSSAASPAEAEAESAPYNIPFHTEGDHVTASIVLKGRVRDRSAALKKLGELLLRMAGE